jgi:hypothetical protein
MFYSRRRPDPEHAFTFKILKAKNVDEKSVWLAKNATDSELGSCYQEGGPKLDQLSSDKFSRELYIIIDRIHVVSIIMTPI